jgi:hypothetical protein
MQIGSLNNRLEFEIRLRKVFYLPSKRKTENVRALFEHHRHTKTPEMHAGTGSDT